MPSESTSGYAVGYKKPPRHTRFKPGKSGNPHGRPRKTETLEETLAKELRRNISIAEGGKRRRTSVLRAILKRYVADAANGNVKSANMILNLFRSQRQNEPDQLSELVQQFRTRNAQLGPDRNQWACQAEEALPHNDAACT